MSIEQTRAKVIAGVWQAIAQSGADLSFMSQEDQEKFVRKLADNLLATVDQILDEAQPAPPPEPEEEVDDKAEKILWEGRPFLSLVEKYVITTERLKIIKGMLSRDIENFELIRIQDVDFKQNVSERVLGIGDITIRGSDKSDEVIVIRNVKDPEAVYEVIRRAWLDARKRYGLQFREYM